MKVLLKVKKKAKPLPPAKAKALKAKKAVLKGIHSQRRSMGHPPTNVQRHGGSEGSLNTFGRKKHPQEKQA